jgi:hypothetical protein
MAEIQFGVIGRTSATTERRCISVATNSLDAESTVQKCVRCLTFFKMHGSSLARFVPRNSVAKFFMIVDLVCNHRE